MGILADAVRDNLSPEAIDYLKSKRGYTDYQADPIGFGENVLGETYTDEVKILMESVRDYPITIAVSATGTGKTHSAARIATWFYKAFPQAKVFTAAAPPIDNLETLLWGEMGNVVRKNKRMFTNDYITRLSISSTPPLSSQTMMDDMEDEEEVSFIKGVTIPTSGTSHERESKFCADADDLFELTTGELVSYKSLIGKTADVISVNPEFIKEPATAEFSDNGIQPVYKITLSNGAVINRTGQHPFYVGKIKQSKKKYGRRYLVQDEKWVKVEDIQVGDAILVPEDTSFNFGSLELDSNEIKVMAYLIGDGCINNCKRVLFIQENNKQLSEFKGAVSVLGARVIEHNLAEYSWKVNGDGSGLKGSNVVLNLLRDHGLLGKDSATKCVPGKINQSNQNCIALFLSRLFSTDGHACMCNCGAYKKAEIGYTSKSEGLVRDIQRLLFKFGISSKVSTCKKTWMHKGIKKSAYYWFLTICRAADIIKFADLIGIYGKEDALSECVIYAKNRRSYAVWRKSKHNGFCWDKIKSIKLLSKKPTVRVHVPKNNTYLTNLVEHNSGKHAPNMLFIFDEGDAVPDEVYKGSDGCMSGGHVRMLIMFNPKAQIGEAYRKIRDGQANVVYLSAFGHPNVITGDDVVPGAVTRDTTVRRINEWCRPLADDETSDNECFELPDFLAGAVAKSHAGKEYPMLEAGYYKIMEPSFSYMVLGRYPAKGSNQLISTAWISAARSRWDVYVAEHGEVPPQGTSAIMGQDVAEFGTDANCTCFRYGNYVERFLTWDGVDPLVTGDRAAVEMKKRDVIECNVDATGVGSGTAPQMVRNGCNNVYPIKVAKSPTFEIEIGEFKILRDQMWWSVREWLRTDDAMLPPDEILLEELATPTYEVVNGKIEVMKKDVMKEALKRSPDRADALCLTFVEHDRLIDPTDLANMPERAV